MSCIILTVEIKEGSTLKQVAEDAMDFASQMMCNVKFTFEGVEMVISENHLPEDIEKEWHMRKKILNDNPDIDGEGLRAALDNLLYF